MMPDKEHSRKSNNCTTDHASIPCISTLQQNQNANKSFDQLCLSLRDKMDPRKAESVPTAANNKTGQAKKTHHEQLCHSHQHQLHRSLNPMNTGKQQWLTSPTFALRHQMKETKSSFTLLESQPHHQSKPSQNFTNNLQLKRNALQFHVFKWIAPFVECHIQACSHTRSSSQVF